MAPRKMHKLSHTSYSFIEKFLSEQWYIVRKDQGNTDTKDKVSIDVIWESFKIFMNDHGYSSIFCNKILLGRLLHQSGVEKIKRGPRKQQRFYYFPIRPVKGSKTEEIYMNCKASEDLIGSSVTAPRVAKPDRGDLRSPQPGPSSCACVGTPLPMDLPANDNIKTEAVVTVAPDDVMMQRCDTKPSHLSRKTKSFSAPGHGALGVSNTENFGRASVERKAQNHDLPHSAVVMNMSRLHESRQNNEEKGSVPGADLISMSNGSTSSTGTNVYDQCFNSALKAPNNLTKQNFVRYERWQGNRDDGRIDQSTTTNVKREVSTTNAKETACSLMNGSGVNYLTAHNSLSYSMHLPEALSYADCFDPLFCRSSSVRPDQQTSTAARSEDGEHSRWTDVPYVPNFVSDSMAGPFPYWGAEVTEPLDLTTINKQLE